MLTTTQGIVLRSIKYGETSLICNVFTRIYGVQTYLVQGVRLAGTRSRQSRAGLLQPGMMLDIVVYHKAQKSLQRMKEFNVAYIYQSIQEDIVKNSISLFSVELLLRLLPEGAPAPELFDFAFDYFRQLDLLPAEAVANFPIFFLVQCSSYLGYEIQGAYSPDTPHLNLHEGGFTAHPPTVRPFVSDEDARALAELLTVREFTSLYKVEMNAGMRQRLLEWYIEFLHRHTEHMGPIRSLPVLQAILH